MQRDHSSLKRDADVGRVQEAVGRLIKGTEKRESEERVKEGLFSLEEDEITGSVSRAALKRQAGLGTQPQPLLGQTRDVEVVPLLGWSIGRNRTNIWDCHIHPGAGTGLRDSRVPSKPGVISELAHSSV